MIKIDLKFSYVLVIHITKLSLEYNKKCQAL